MKRRALHVWLLVLVLLTASSGVLVRQAQAEPPWKRLLPFNKVASASDGDYSLKEDHGPWLILATSFAGPGAEEQARELVLELRGRYQLEAFIHKKDYDYTGDVEGLGLDKYGNPKRMKHRKDVRFTEYAVLVGQYESIEDPRVPKDLDKIKEAHPKCLEIKSGDASSTQRFAGLLELYRNLNPEKRGQGPMHRAFVARNPLIPKEYFVAQGIDEMVLSMNQGVEHSLLKNPGTYTVKVATFRGETKFDTELKGEEQESSWLGSLGQRNQPSKLELAAENAHRLTKALRKQGVEAYEFHDRFESIVTVGSFDSVGTPRADGKTEINPSIHRIMQAYGAQRTTPGQVIAGEGDVAPGSVLIPRKLQGIPLDVQPVPVLVPKQSLANRFSSR